MPFPNRYGIQLPPIRDIRYHPDIFCVGSGSRVDFYFTAVVTDALRCVPHQNKPVGDEITNCREFLHATITSLPRLRVILALGKIAHDSTIPPLQLTQREFPFGHGARHVAVGNEHPIEIVSSYHCSRYNINTRRLTVGMFDSIFQTISTILRES